ncbi:hypothetical protein [Streptomyces sp. LN590]|uniref:hypothetical protein n=1 Tax=Streptomyces sp. LN590 TaxID=3112980 RepID=UPI0037120A62
MAAPGYSRAPGLRPPWSLEECWRFARREGVGARIETDSEVVRVVIEYANGNELDLYPDGTSKAQQPTT